MPANVSRRPTSRGFRLRYWMERVLDEIDQTSRDFTPDAVHDLRVALRRCRSTARGFMALDSDKIWGALQKDARRLFRRLGELRDAQVMRDWVLRIGIPEDPVTLAILIHLAGKERELQQAAVKSLRAFDREKWRGHLDRLHSRALLLPPGSPVAQLITLQAWTEAHELHKQALRNRSSISYHRLRIGIKRFRYSVENFLPRRYEEWGADLKEIQDCLGDAQDLHVLWVTLLKLRLFPDPGSRERWRALIAGERAKCVGKYKEKMVGSSSLWMVWRKALPPPGRLLPLGHQMIEKWASLHGIDLVKTRRVRHLALHLFNGLKCGRLAAARGSRDHRTVLDLAATLHEVGRAKRMRSLRNAAEALLGRLHLQPGLWPRLLESAERVIRCQRGRFADLEGEDPAALSRDEGQLVMELAGILRLARTIARGGDVAIGPIMYEPASDLIVIHVAGYEEFGPAAEKAARARSLLEGVYRRPIILRDWSARANSGRGLEHQQPGLTSSVA